MKKLLICTTLFALNITTALAQCGNDNTQVGVDLTPAGSGLSVSSTFASGQYATAYVFSGVTYQVSTCGSSGFDTQLTVYDESGSFLAYNDDFCGLQSTVSFTPASCGFVRVLLDQYSCNNSGLSMNVTMTQLTTSSTDATIACAPDTTVMADTGLCTASGIVLDMPTVTCGHFLTNNAPVTYNVGTTAVTWQVIGDNDTATCVQNVIVIDNQLPVVSFCPADTTLNTDSGVCQATGVVLDMPIATDNCGIATITNDAPAVLNEGPTLVTWTITDVNGNMVTCTHTVTVVDNENPVIVCPADTTMNTEPGICSATPTDIGTPLVTDNCGVDSTSNDSPGTFPKGITTVTWMVTDVHGHTTTCPQVITVVDAELPVITCPANMSITANYDNCSAIVTWAPATAGDNCGIDTLYADHNSGDTLMLGTTTVTYTVTDESGNTNTCSFDITVSNSLMVSVVNATDLNCNGDMSGAIDVSTSGGITPYTYDWDNDGTGDMDDTEDLTGLAAGTYMLNVTDSVGCTTGLSQSLTEPSALSISATATPQSVVTPPNGSIDLSVNGGVTPYIYDWSNDGTGDTDDTQDLTDLTSGTYTVVVTDDNGCTQSTNAVVGNTTGITPLQAAPVVQVYPNPSNGTFTIGLGTSAENTVLEIYNGVGEKIHSAQLTGTTTPVSVNGNGLVLVRVKQNDTYIYTVTMMIQR